MDDMHKITILLCISYISSGVSSVGYVGLLSLNQAIATQNPLNTLPEDPVPFVTREKFNVTQTLHLQAIVHK